MCLTLLLLLFKSSLRLPFLSIVSLISIYTSAEVALIQLNVLRDHTRAQLPSFLLHGLIIGLPARSIYS